MNIYDKLNEIVPIKKYSLLYDLFLDSYKQELDTDEDRKIFDLLKNITSLAAKISYQKVEFCPRLVMQGKSTFSVDDITEDDYNLLRSLDISEFPLNLKARIADILWTQKRKHQFGITAAETYFELYNLWFSDDWHEALNMIKRTICISLQIRKNDLCEKSYQSLRNHLVEINGTDSGFLSLSLIHMLLEYSYDNTDELIGLLDTIIKSNFNNLSKTEKAYQLKAMCYKNQKNPEQVAQVNICLANYYVSYAESLLKGTSQDQLKSQCFFIKAISLYRNNGESSKAEFTNKRLVEIQKIIPQLMKPINLEIDIKEINNRIEEYTKGLTFCECISKIIFIVNYYKKDEIKKEVLNDLQTSPFLSMIKNTVVNEDGQSISVLPGLDLSNPEGNQELLDLHIHKKMHEYQEIAGSTVLRCYISYIKNHFDIGKEDLSFLFQNNGIIPDGREGIIHSAVLMALKEEYYEALHILAPQTENIFRNIAKAAGGLTETLENDETSKKKVLSSIFKLPELKDCYDNDILFLFEGLLNERVGANIRNEIAHGIMNPSSANSGDKIYFICAFIKLLVLTSPQCQIILDECPN